MKKGLSLEEAKRKVKERQTTNSLDAFIKRSGGDVEEGKRRWQERQEKWLKSLEDRGWFGKHSEVSKRLFSELKRQTGLDLRFAENELTVRTGNRFCKLDCSIPGSKKAIEFFGDYWHANPKKYAETDVIRRLDEGSYITAREIWNRDATRIDTLRRHGFDVLVVWEDDYTQDEAGITDRCIAFLNR